MENIEPSFESCVRERLEMPKAVMLQLRETQLFNALIDQALEDIDFLLKRSSQ